MAEIIKVYLGLFMLLLLLVLGVGIIGAVRQAENARLFHEDVIEELQCSNFSPGVESACAELASAQGYQLSITPIRDEEGEILMEEVILRYPYKIPILDLSLMHETRGYAR